MALAIALLGVLFPPSSHGQSRLWRANLAGSQDFLPGLSRSAPDTALIRSPESGRRLELASDAGWNGILHREGGSSSEVLSARTSHSLWAVPLPGSALGLRWSGELDRNRLIEPNQLDLRLGVERGKLGLAWMQHLLPRERPPALSGDGPAPGRPFLDLGVLIPDRKRQGFAWMLAGGREGAWRLEYGLVQEEVVEDFDVVNLDTNGSGEEVKGLYQGRVTAHRLVAKAAVGGGSLSALATYGFGRPRRPDREFWFCDSSRNLEGRLAFSRPGFLGGWEAWGDFQEGEAYSIGRRLPPGSDGVKRFHFARNHSTLWELGSEAGPRSWRLGSLYRRMTWSSDPPEDALDTRRETLSYNRLGLSFIANLYGGLYKMSELRHGRAKLGLWELNGRGSGSLGPFFGEAGLSLYRTGFEAEAIGHSLSQRIVVIDTTYSFRRKYRGYLLGATPRLLAGLESGFLRLEIEAAQAFPAFVEVRKEVQEFREGVEVVGGGGGGGNGGGGVEPSGQEAPEYSLFRNGFSARVRLVAGF